MNVRPLISALLVAFATCANAEAVLRNAASLARAMHESYGEGSRFDLSGVVTYVCTNNYNKEVNLAVEDASGAVLVRLLSHSRPSSCPRRGDMMNLFGSIKIHSNGHCFAIADGIRFLTLGEASSPVELTPDRLKDSAWHYRYGRFRGILKDVVFNELNPDYLLFIIDAGVEHGVFTTAPIFSPDALERMEALVGRPVEATGVTVPFDHSSHLYPGPVFKTSGIEDIRPVEDASDTLTSVSGHVVAVRRGAKRIVLKTDDGAILSADIPNSPLPAYGDHIEATGLEESDLYRRMLFNARWRSRNDKHPFIEESVTPVSPRDMIRDAKGRRKVNRRYDGRPVRITGIIRALPSDDPEGNMLVDCDACTVPVDASSLPGVVNDAETGCTVEVSGTCVLDVAAPVRKLAVQRLRGFTIVLRTPADFRILKRPPWWTPARVAAVIGTLFALLIAVLVWNAALRRLASRKGRELMREQIGHVMATLKTEERTHLAAELHDSLAQALSGISLEIDTVKKLAPTDRPNMNEHLDIAARALKSCRIELRHCLWDLRNRALETTSMDKAIRQTLAPVLHGEDIALRFNIPRARLTDNTAHAILRIIRELVINSIRHGGATKIWIAGAMDDGGIRFSVRDNGSGFDPATAPSFAEGHYGLLGIRERIASFEGTFVLDSSPGRGTEATVTIPSTRKETT